VGYHDTVSRCLARAGVSVSPRTPAGTTIGVAEHAVLLTLAVLRRLPFADAELRQGRGISTASGRNPATQGPDRGLFGMGRIGQAAAARFRAFETRGLYSDPAMPSPPPRRTASASCGPRTTTSWPEADIVTLHLPPLQEPAT
jgi:phosphoglycerate dehydrogenase-like enzyme